jgi:hypothetical protein
MKSKLIQILKILISDVRQASVPTILLWLAGGAGGLYSAYKMVVDGITQTINIRTPLWATILAVLLVSLYIYKKNRSVAKKIDELSQSLCPPMCDIKDKIKFIFHNNLLWLQGDKAPFCPVCYEVNEKPIHMLLKETSNNYKEWEYYECHACYHRTDFSEHPLEAPF